VAQATAPPAPGQDWSPALTKERLRQLQFKRSLIAPARQARLNRQRAASGAMTRNAALSAPYGIAVAGSRSIPVLTGTYANTPGNPYPVANLQQELFDGPWPTGTMTEIYSDMSYGQLTVDGTVFNWVGNAENDTFYEGPAGCNGLCNGAKVGEFLTEVLDQVDGSIDFGDYDNDGPDNIPNSGDDDGFVDFVAFVHPEAGGECGNNNVWSHRWVYSGWTGSEYVTDDNIQGTITKIRIDDYVIQPAFACDGTTMIEIGVFAHEFGHAFGLPDLYDTDTSNGSSAGIGSWGLMASGSWGGDGNSPDRPSHMSAWAKEFLGWINPTTVTADQMGAAIANVEQNSFAYKLSIDSNRYYLIANRQRIGFDDSLKSGGLAIWKINDSVINAGLTSNTVNADENNQGVELMEADGNNSLDNNVRSEAGDLFTVAGSDFDNSTTPASSGNNAVCDISAPASTMTADLLVSTGTCNGQIRLTLSLNPNTRLGLNDTAVLWATLRDPANNPIAGETVSFASADTSLATVSPSAVTNAAGVAQATVRGETRINNSTDINVTAAGASAQILVKVPVFGGLHWSAVVFVALLLGWALRRRLFA
ncbi:MAG: M6 family metalloprotease domain-containing protein, partial [Planctomycetes bacterium]|nr:M6 family metalloprotease domain-containing protein [Planctomycetota bacterium]